MRTVTHNMVKHRLTILLYQTLRKSSLQFEGRVLHILMVKAGIQKIPYMALFDNFLEACQIFAHDFTYLYLNDAAARHNRRPNAELLGRTMTECWQGIENTDVFKMLKRSVSERVALQEEIEFRFADGSFGWYDVRSSPIPEGVIVLSQEITQKKLQERESERHERLFTALNKINHTILRTTDPATLFQKAVETLVDAAGFKMAWIGWCDETGRRIVPSAERGDDEHYLDDIEVLTDDSPHGNGPTGTAYKTHIVQICNNMRSDVKLAPWREKFIRSGFHAIAAIPILAPNSTGVLSVYADEIDFFQEKEIMLLKEVAADLAFALQNFEREREKRALEESAERAARILQAMMDSLPGIAYFFRRSGEYIRWNRNLELVTGYSHEEIARMHPLDFYEPVEKIKVAERIGEVFAHGKSSVEAIFVRKDGQKLAYYLTGCLVEFDGEPCLLGVGIDISELQKAQNEVLRLNAELEQRVEDRTIELKAINRELEAFSYSVSHDLRAPLRAVNGFAEIVLAKFSALLPDDGKRYLDRIRNGAHRMGELIDDLLAFSRLGRGELALANMEMRPLVDSALEELLPARQGRSLTIDIGELPACYGDAKTLRQVWLNLIGNAIKYTRTKNDAHIEIGSVVSDDEIRYFVKDDGVGFNMAYASKLFGVFQRLHRDDEFEGTGVGLAIVQRVINRHGGRVGAEAEENKGAKFWFTLGRHRENK